MSDCKEGIKKAHERIDGIQATIKVHERVLWILIGFALANVDKLPAVFKILGV